MIRLHARRASRNVSREITKSASIDTCLTGTCGPSGNDISDQFEQRF